MLKTTNNEAAAPAQTIAASTTPDQPPGGTQQPQPPAPEQKSDPIASLPDLFPAAAGEWKLQDKPSVFVGDQIFQFIDGAGELFLTYKFIAAANAIYQAGDDLMLSVEVFRMANKDEAYGVFSMNQPPEYTTDPQNPMILFTPQSAHFWAGNDYIRIVAFDDNDKVREGIKLLREKIAPLCRGLDDLPPLAQALPKFYPFPITDTGVAGLPRYFHAKMAFDNIHFIPRDLFGLGSDTSAAWQGFRNNLKQNPPNAPFLEVMIIAYPTPDAEKKAAANSLKLDDGSSVLAEKFDPDPQKNGSCVIAFITGKSPESEDFKKEYDSIIESIKSNYTSGCESGE